MAQTNPFYGVYDAIEYEFDDMSPAERAAATDLLVAAGVSYRWDPGFRLQVPSEHEQQTDALLADLRPYEPPADEGAEARAVASAGDDARGDIDTERGDEQGQEPAEWASDEASVHAMASLFDAADRLRHDPENETAAAELADATAVVASASVPFAVNPVLWRTVGDLARQLSDLLEAKADAGDIFAGADALRAVLRDHV